VCSYRLITVRYNADNVPFLRDKRLHESALVKMHHAFAFREKERERELGTRSNEVIRRAFVINGHRDESRGILVKQFSQRSNFIERNFLFPLEKESRSLVIGRDRIFALT